MGDRWQVRPWTLHSYGQMLQRCVNLILHVAHQALHRAVYRCYNAASI